MNREEIAQKLRKLADKIEDPNIVRECCIAIDYGNNPPWEMNGARIIFRPAGNLQWLQGIEIYHVHLVHGVDLTQYEVDEINSRIRC